MTMTLISTVTVGAGGASTIEFASIPQTGTDLMVVLSWDGTANGSFPLTVQLNSTTNTIRRLYGTVLVGSSTADQIAYMDSEYPTTNTFHSLQMYIPNYTTAQQHSFSVDAVVESNNTSQFGYFGQITAGLNSSTSAVTNLKFVPSYLLFAQNSTASLYSITKGSGGATVS